MTGNFSRLKSFGMPATKALVTGATGFVGKNLVKHLLKMGWKVTILVRDARRLPPALLDGCKVVVGDLKNRQDIADALFDVDVVFHCAANVSTWDAKDAYYSANVSGVENLLHAIADLDRCVRLLHMSTMDVYGFPVQPCTEDAVVLAAGFGYGDSKLHGEKMVREFCTANGIPFTIFRPGNIIGPESQFIERIGEELSSGVMLKISGGKENAGLIYIDNLISLMIWAVHEKSALGQCYNVRDPYDICWSEFISRFRSGIHGKGVVFNLPFNLAEGIAKLFEVLHKNFFPNQEPLLHRLIVRIFGRTCGHDARKIYLHSKLLPAIDFDEAMRRSIEWFNTEKLPPCKK